MFVGLAMVLFLPIGVFAQVTSLKSEEKFIDDGRERSGTLQVYKMTVTPAAAPVPAFKYRLAIPPVETIPGNAATHYLRSIADGKFRRAWNQMLQEYGDDSESWCDQVESPFAKLPLDQVRDASKLFDSFVEHYLDKAIYCRDCDWGFSEEDLRGKEASSFPLPGIQASRDIAYVLVLRARLAVADGRYDDALTHLRMTHQLAQHVSQVDFLIAGLVGMSIVNRNHSGLLDLIAATNSPNLYWALAELPRPVIHIRNALRLEMSSLTRYHPILLDIEHAQYSDDQWAHYLNELLADVKMMVAYPNDRKTLMETRVATLAAGGGSFPCAKQRLLDSGMDAQQVDKMAIGHVVLLDAARDYRRFSDEFEKLYYLPYASAMALESQFTLPKHSKLLEDELRLGHFLAVAFLPITLQAREAEVRTQWQINALQVIEAIRLHAAAHGEFPQTLNQMELPAPLNPFTNKPYQYHVDGDTAIIDMPFSDGATGIAQRYEIKLAPQQTRANKANRLAR